MPLLTALRGSGLDDPSTLLHYPVDWKDEGERGVPSGATSTGHSSIPLLRTGSSSSDRVVGTRVVDVGGDPRTVHALSGSVGTAVGLDMQRKGGRPEDRPACSLGRRGKNRPACSVGRRRKKPTTAIDRAATQEPTTFPSMCKWLVWLMIRRILPSRGGWQPKLPRLTLFLPAPDPVLAISRAFDAEDLDGFPCIEESPEYRDGFPCNDEDQEVRDVFPRSEDLQGQAHSEGLNSTSDMRKLPYFHGFYALQKSPNDSASRISEFKSCPLVAAHPS